jgi:D-alanine-D-alanine ligase-like ATP-grasp enzyme
MGSMANFGFAQAAKFVKRLRLNRIIVMSEIKMKNGSTITFIEGSGEKVTGYTQKYLDKEPVNVIPEKLDPEYEQWLDSLVADEQQQDYLNKDNWPEF